MARQRKIQQKQQATNRKVSFQIPSHVRIESVIIVDEDGELYRLQLTGK